MGDELYGAVPVQQMELKMPMAPEVRVEPGFRPLSCCGGGLACKGANRAHATADENAHHRARRDRASVFEPLQIRQRLFSCYYFCRR